MPLGNFQQAGTLPRPLIIGRLGRLAFGLGCLFFFVWLMVHRDAFVGSSVPEFGWWIGVFFSFYYLPDLVVVGLSLPWGRLSQVAALIIAAVLFVANLAAYQSAWAPPLGWGLFTFTGVFYVSLGVSFLIAAFLSVPG